MLFRSKETGLFLHMDNITREIKVIKSSNIATNYFVGNTTIHAVIVTDEQGITESCYSYKSDEQKDATNHLLELMARFKMDNRCSASGFINLNTYDDIPIKYGVSGQPLALPTVSGYRETLIGAQQHSTTYVKKPSYLVTPIAYYAEGGAGNPNNKIKILARKTDLPSEKYLKVMEKRVEKTASGTFKTKAIELSEKSKEAPFIDEKAIAEVYGDEYVGYCY